MNQFAKYLLNKQLKKLGINQNLPTLMLNYVWTLAKSRQVISSLHMLRNLKIIFSNFIWLRLYRTLLMKRYKIPLNFSQSMKNKYFFNKKRNQF
jgi:hypothetical protein